MSIPSISVNCRSTTSGKQKHKKPPTAFQAWMDTIWV